MLVALMRLTPVLLFALLTLNAIASPYASPARRAADWLGQQSNVVDGSWGEASDVRYLYTAEAVQALAALNRRTAEYYGGLTWLENHSASNIDFKARRVLALQANGNDISQDVGYIQTAPSALAPSSSGWGLSAAYQASPLDTALSVLALKQAGKLDSIPNGLSYLKSVQLSGTKRGWAVGQENVVDPATTAQVLRTLTAFSATDASLATPIANGIAALGGMVTTESSTTHQALAALAAFSHDQASSYAVSLLNSLLIRQRSDGSWDGNVYVTSLVIQALSSGMAAELELQRSAVNVLDANLRTAINVALGRNALDGLNKGDLASLTTLDISNRGIKSIQGLEFAQNLTYLDARNNQISSFDLVTGLPNLATLLTEGNPGHIVEPMKVEAIMNVINILLLD